MMTSLIALLNVAVAVGTVKTLPHGGQLLQAAMPPCKRCGAARLPSRDELLATDDGELNKMKIDLTDEVQALEDEVRDLKSKNGAELGKLNKRLSDMNVAYKKFGEDAVARSSKFATAKADAAKSLDSSLVKTDAAHKEIATIRASLEELRTYLNPYVNKFISGSGWPHGCKCPAAKALLQSLQASLQLASVDLDGLAAETASSPSLRGEVLLRKSTKLSSPDMEKYKLVRAVQQLAERRAKLMQEKTAAIADYSQKQRVTLDRIDAARVKARLKVTTEAKYEDSDATLKKSLKDQTDAAGDYLSSAESQLARLKKHRDTSLKHFKAFKAELQKCKCL